MEVTRFDMLDEVMNDLKLRMLLWESLNGWAKTVDEWYKVDFNTLNVEDMNLLTAKYMKNITQLEKGLPKNLIVPKLKDSVELMKDKVNINDYITFTLCKMILLLLASCGDIPQKPFIKTKALA